MMMHSMRGMAVVATVGAMTLISVRAQEAEIRINQLPKAVADAARARFPGAKWHGASRDVEDGKTYYDIEMTLGDRDMDVSFLADGTLDMVETEVDEDELPAAVSRSIKNRFPGARIKLAEAVREGPVLRKDVDYYELHLATPDRKSLAVEVDSKGKILKAAADTED
jgi:uncharacterized membrane protein YkoI